MKTDPTIVTWDYRGQPDWDEINFALVEQIDAFIHPVASGTDQYAIVIGPRKMTSEDAQKAYDHWWNKQGVQHHD